MKESDCEQFCLIDEKDYEKIVKLIKAKSWPTLNLTILNLKRKGIKQLQLAKMMHRLVHEARKNSSSNST